MIRDRGCHCRTSVLLRVLPAFGHKGFGTLTAARCELPVLTNPVRFFMGHTASVNIVIATQPPRPDTEGRKVHDWRRGSICLLLVLAVISGCRVWPDWGGQARNMAEVQRCEERQTYSHSDFSFMRVIFVSGCPENIAPSPRAQSCMDVGLNKTSWQCWLMQLQQSAV